MDPVVIIGGGITGVGLARDLALRGIETILLERGHLGSETSLHTHGVLHSGARYAVADPEAARQCIDENRTLRQIAPHAIRETGGYFLSMEQDSEAYYRKKLRACKDCGIPVDERDSVQLRDELPQLADDVEQGFTVPDSVVDPRQLLGATAQDAMDNGATIKCGTAVTDIDVDDGSVASVTVSDHGETVPASHVVNCGGPWAGTIAAQAGLEVDIRPVKGAMTVVANPGVRHVLNRCRPVSDGDIILPSGDQAVIGTTSIEIDDPDTIPEAEREEQQLLDEGASMVPGIRESNVVGTYWGARPLYSTEDNSREMSRDWFLLEHEDDGVSGMTTLVGGKLTTHRRMAAAAANRICKQLGVHTAASTAERELPDSTPDRLLPDQDWPPAGG